MQIYNKISAMTSEEAMVQGGLDWTVETGDVWTTIGDEVIELPKYKSIIRSDTRDVLSVMSDKYTPLQNKDKFKWADQLVAQGGAVFEQVGYFGRGEVNWLLAKLPDGLDFGNSEDVLDKYLMFADSYDGTLAFITKFTTIRPVCRNTFHAAIKQVQRGTHRVKHTPNMLGRISDVRESLGLVDAYYTMLGEKLKRLADKELEDYEVFAFFQQSLEMKEYASTRSANIHGKLMDLYQGDALGSDVAGKTAWGALNALTEYTDHHASFKGNDESNRTKSAWLGQGEKLKQRGFDILMASVDNMYELVPAKVKVGKEQILMEA
tara:strand:- start:307 stop:1269 length:963 start_codon:yes stop_codon:yes gene_type:complete